MNKRETGKKTREGKPLKILMMDSGAMNLAGLLQEEDPGVERFVYHPDATEQKPVSWGQILALIKKIRAGEYGAALFGESSHAWWRPGKGMSSGLRRMVADGLFRPERCVQKIIPRILQACGVPFFVVDRNDRPKIDPACFLLYGLSHTYFMRELPPRRLDLFPNAQEVTGFLPLLPSAFPEKKVPVQTEKLRPISLGIDDGIFKKCEVSADSKTIDVFWAGKWDTNEARRRWVQELMESAPREWVIKVCEERMPHEEYLHLVKQSRMVLSPPGRGWDCYRHYEIAACGSVPLMSYPTIERDHPLIDHEHGFYFGAEPGGLARCLQGIHSQKPNLIQMGRDAQDHVRRNHRWSVQSDRMRRALEELCCAST